MKWLALALGGVLGSFVRFGLSELGLRFSATGSFPYPTLLVNVIGSFIAGIVMVIIIEKMMLNEYWRLLLLVGFAGSLTTFSAFSLETLYLIETHAYLKALGNIVVNVMLSLLAVFLGAYLVRGLTS